MSNLFVIDVDRKYGFIDEVGRVVISPRFQLAVDFREGLAVVRDAKTSQAGAIDEAGNWVIPPEFMAMQGFSEGWAPMSGNGDHWGYIGPTGERIEPAFADAHWFVDGLAFAKSQDRLVGLIDKSGEWVVAPSYEKCDTGLPGETSGRRLVMKDEKWGFLDDRGEVAIPLQFTRAFPFWGGVARVWVDHKPAGCIHPDGRWAFQGPELCKEAGEGLVPACADQWGFKDLDGNWAIEPKYWDVDRFVDGLAPAQSSSKRWGYIDRHGKWVVKAAYGHAGSFSRGLGRVSKKNEWAYLDREGKIVWKTAGFS